MIGSSFQGNFIIFGWSKYYYEAVPYRYCMEIVVECYLIDMYSFTGCVI